MTLRSRDACPLCGSPASKTLLTLPFGGPEVSGFLTTYYAGRVEAEYLRGGNYVLCRCNACGGMWQRDILDDAGMARLYGAWISPEKSRARRANPALSLQYARHCARLTRLFPDPSAALLLDYGMGWGDWCHMARSFGFRVHGVELSEERVAHAKSLGISASGPDALPEGPVHFVYLEQVLEHVPDPRRLIASLVVRLVPGGYIHIGVPNGQWVEAATSVKDHARLLKKGAAQPLEHINIFTPRSLRTLLASFDCEPASQREGLLRVSPPKQLLQDVCLAAARLLPATVFPNGTSVLFRKAR